jgi:rare lipoprotein A
LASILRAFSRRVFVVVLTAIAASGLALLAAGPGEAEPIVASWYGPGFEGARTSSGEPFDSKGYTAASRTLPLGTKLLVTYKDRSVAVRVNDRGPFSKAELDLSQAAAEYIGLTAPGTTTVEAVTIDPTTPTGPYKAKAAAPAVGDRAETRQEPAAPQKTPQGPEGGDPRPGEVVWDEGAETPETGEVTGDEATEHNEILEDD